MQNLSLVCWVMGKKRTDSASSKACLLKQMLMKTSWRTDLDPADFFLSPTLKGHHFQDIEEVKENATTQLYAIKQNAFQKWKKLWKPAVASGGDHFEGDSGENNVSYLIKLFYSQFGLFLNIPRKYRNKITSDYLSKWKSHRKWIQRKVLYINQTFIHVKEKLGKVKWWKMLKRSGEECDAYLTHVCRYR